MKKAILLFFTTVSVCSGFNAIQESDTKYTEYCMLPLINLENAVGSLWHLKTNSHFIVTDAKQNKKDTIESSSLFIYIDQSHFAINGIRIKSRTLYIESTDGILCINGASYRGQLLIRVKNGIPSIFVFGVKEFQAVCYFDYDLHTNQNNRDLQDQDSKESLGIESKDGILQDIVDKNSKENNEGFIDELQSLRSVKSCKIRVLLDQLKPETVLEKLKSGIISEKIWLISSQAGFMVGYSRPENKQEIIQSKELVIKRGYNNQLYLNNKKCKDTFVCIMPRTGNLVFNGCSYQGSLLISQNKEVVSIINSIDLEDYIFGVLRTESMPGWPLEIHKVFAIACRSYAIAMAMRAHKLKRVYHIKNTNEHQTYTGAHSDNRLRQAVEETRGMFIAYNNEPIIAMYDICCGGIIPAHMSNFNFKNAPYLARSYACSYCKLCKPYSWEAVCTLKDFEGMVSQSIRKVKNIKSVTVSKKDKAGLVSEIVLKNSGRPITFSGKKMYSLMKDIKSFCFQAHKSGNSVIFKGKGYGHHVGLCQWGAREMVRCGWNHKKILEFYYPGTYFKRIS